MIFVLLSVVLYWEEGIRESRVVQLLPELCLVLALFAHITTPWIIV